MIVLKECKFEILIFLVKFQWNFSIVTRNSNFFSLWQEARALNFFLTRQAFFVDLKGLNLFSGLLERLGTHLTECKYFDVFPFAPKSPRHPERSNLLRVGLLLPMEKANPPSCLSLPPDKHCHYFSVTLNHFNDEKQNFAGCDNRQSFKRTKKNGKLKKGVFTARKGGWK